jgi:hypothetical protein
MKDPETTFTSLLTQLSRCPGVSDEVLDQCQDRYDAGITTFISPDGQPAYLTRDNAAEGMEEAADGINYAVMESLRRAANGQEDKRDLALSAAHHFALAHWALMRLQAVDG